MKKNYFILITFLGLVACSEDMIYIEDGLARSTKPYCIRGYEYEPQEYYNYDQEGCASWYGGFFHGRKNAAGYPFNKYKWTAAHRTLPIPSIVEVTNLDNGKQILVLIDDRGPFCQTNKRIIDLSYGAACALDMASQGIGRVRVKCLAKESKFFSNYLKSLQKGYGKNIDWVHLFECMYLV